MKEKIIIKIGTSTLTEGNNHISLKKIEEIACQIQELKKTYDIILVSSWAIATARQFINMGEYSKNIASKQAMAAIWQVKLIAIYDTIFSKFNIHIAQCLLTSHDFKDIVSEGNMKNTIHTLLSHNYLPIINENDTVSTDEIILWDNDKLSALLGKSIWVKYLLIVSDIDGLYNKNPHLNKDATLVKEVKNLKEIKNYIQEKSNHLWKWGMTSKILAAEICQKSKIEMCIINGKRENFLVNAIENKIPFTKFKF